MVDSNGMKTIVSFYQFGKTYKITSCQVGKRIDCFLAIDILRNAVRHRGVSKKVMFYADQCSNSHLPISAKRLIPFTWFSPLRRSAVQLHADRQNTGTKRPKHPQGAWHDVQKDTKKLLAALMNKTEKQQPMTLLEKEFLKGCGLAIDNKAKKRYNRWYKII